MYRYKKSITCEVLTQQSSPFDALVAAGILKVKPMKKDKNLKLEVVTKSIIDPISVAVAVEPVDVSITQTMTKLMLESKKNLKSLPRELIIYILEYIIPVYSKIEFGCYEDKDVDNDDGIEMGYRNRNKDDLQIAYYNNLKVKNDNYFLTRIYKKNGKHRYYISERYIIDMCDKCNGPCGGYRYCHGRLYCVYSFNNKYIGKNIIETLIVLYRLNEYIGKDIIDTLK